MPRRDFINLNSWSSSELSSLLESCARLKREHRLRIRHTHLLGRNIGLIFEKASLRTRISFEVGINQLGGSAIVLGDSAGRIGEREPIADFARVTARYVDALVIRTYDEQVIVDLSKHAGIPVVNALSDQSHPCQALGDVFTLKEKWGSLQGRTMAYVGDSNNVAASLMRACDRFGIEMRVASPEGYEFDAEAQNWGKEKGFIFTRDPKEAVSGADVIYTDVWTSMGQEKEKEKRLQDFQGFQLNMSLLSHAKPDAYIMHCLPAHRGEEITDEVMECERSIVFDQAENRLHIQKAILVNLILGAMD